ncbi:hypothetical protein KP509_03G020300, partial [Ceratopteris richardii]
MVKRAVLVGCNYPGTNSELHGCVNDVTKMYKTLISGFGFRKQDITIPIDTESDYLQPTGANIKRALNKMIVSSKKEHVLFFHYSGHGTRLPLESGEEDETGYDECIVPCDMNLIDDNDMRELIEKLPSGAAFTAISDSCHSGGLIKGLKEQIGDSFKRPFNKTNRNYGKFKRGKLEHGEGCFMKALKSLKAKLDETDDGDAYLQSAKMGKDLCGPKEAYAGRKTSNSVMDMAVLVSGCQSNETSADADPDGNPTHAYGALSNAIQTVLDSYQADQPISNSYLVNEVCCLLASQKFKQKPGLYCADDNLDAPFIFQQ